MPLQDRCRHFRQVTQMLHEAFDARRKTLPCERHPAHVGYREARFPWPLDTYPTVAAPAEADHREARRGCVAEVVVHALVPLWPHLRPAAPSQGVCTSHKPLRVRLTGHLAQG